MEPINKNQISEDVVYDDFEDVAATAQMAHYGQKRRSGEDYFTHPSEVAQIVKKYYPTDKISRLVALLHDTMEDAPSMGTVKDIDEMKSFIRGSIGDPQVAEEVIEAVESLTHDKKSMPDYGAYVATILGKKFALRVKLADMLHNLTNNASDKQKKKYGNALRDISLKVGGIPKSISPHHWRALAQASQQDLSPSKKMMESTRKTTIMTKTQLKQVVKKFIKEQVETDIKSKFDDFLYSWFSANEELLLDSLLEYTGEGIAPSAIELTDVFLDDIKSDVTDAEIRKALMQNQKSLMDMVIQRFAKFISKNWDNAQSYSKDVDRDYLENQTSSWLDSFSEDDPYSNLA